MLKRVTSIILCAVLLLGLTACVAANEEQKESEETAMDPLNKIWELWVEGEAESPYAELMTYQSEVNNGGHDQYFFNVSQTGDLEKELSVLETVLSPKLNANLQKAYSAYLVLEEKEEDEAAEALLEQCDDAFYENEEEINQTLKQYASQIP